jgi:alpha-galactosidase
MRRFALIVTAIFFGGAWCAAETVQLSTMQLGNLPAGIAAADKSIGGAPIAMGGKTYAHGVGMTPGKIVIDLGKRATRFTAPVGVDDDVKGKPGGTLAFAVFGDGRRLYPPLQPGGRGNRGGRGVLPPVQDVQTIDVDLTGVRVLVLELSPGTDGAENDHGDWADAAIEFTGAAPAIAPPQRDEPIVLTPRAPETPRINGARIFGARPGNPFMFTIPATGVRPMTFAAEGLPAGLSLDANTGFITGVATQRGEYNVKLTATNVQGKAGSTLKIVIGDTIALTPAMGWNSWNCFASAVDAEKVKSAADAMVNSGLINHGWTYVNIDDFWEIYVGNNRNLRADETLQGDPRQPDGTINTNKRFPDMKALTDYIHGKGLKAGLYSSPGPTTCGGCVASYEHELQDAKTWAGWGFDYIKYDWCSYGNIVRGQPQTREYHAKPYQVMRDALNQVNRDIIYSLCQYGNGNVWEWGADVGGNSWRTTGDIRDTWDSLSSIGFSQAGHEAFAGPGHWNDPDMLIVGYVGWGPNLHPTRLTPNEQYTHITLWSLLCSPLLIGCDMTKFDDFTLNLLTNDEVIAVNQDPLGKQAGRIAQDGELEIWAKPMQDGSKAVGLFIRSELGGFISV